MILKSYLHILKVLGCKIKLPLGFIRFLETSKIYYFPKSAKKFRLSNNIKNSKIKLINKCLTKLRLKTLLRLPKNSNLWSKTTVLLREVKKSDY